MNRIIIVKNRVDSITYGFADAFAKNSVSTLICEKDEVEAIPGRYQAKALFSTSFDRNVSDICLKNNLPAIFWIWSLPDPALFCPHIINENNRIFIPDEITWEIFRKTGLKNIFFPDGCRDLTDYSAINDRDRFLSDRIMMCLEKDELSYLKGMLRAQQAFPEESILFRALGEEMINRMYSIAGLPEGDLCIKKRYVISECILRPLVTKSTGQPASRNPDFDRAVKMILLQNKGLPYNGSPLA